MQKLYEVIKRPVVSEKSSALAEVAGRYVFEVDRDANKHQVRTAVEQLFGVNVAKVRTMVVHGKVKRVGRQMVKKSNWKKAIITLQSGESIDFFQTQS